MQSHPDLDQEFLSLLSSNGITSTNLAATVNAAHTLCTRLSLGEPEPQIVRDWLAGSTDMTLAQAQFAVDTAINIYCPRG
ncbi:MAG: DUF732 domain-containing protein [Mycobacterium sp.]|uniref:DUF732 domain-containing protein n=1 Tax=Mycobacterium sp. TaxID=1785 RepID=UPI00263337C3|nr:DUF732 domain-containing protein [Mycobacterium sp.]MDI3312962.1 DUF732 domain-containing protein [Mycobacterium sp.]